MFTMSSTKTPGYVPAPPADATPLDVLAPHLAAWGRDMRQAGMATGSRAGATVVLIGGLIVAAGWAIAMHWHLGV